MKTTLSLALCLSSLSLASDTDLDDDARRNRDPDRQPDPNGGYCTWDEELSEGRNKQTWMRRCGRIDEEVECGSWASAHGYTDGACQWVPAVEWLSYDETGFPLYTVEGFAVLQAYDEEMCGGRNADEACYECFECSSGGGRCVPIDDCTPHCEVDDDCTREQICTDDDKICQLPDGPPSNDRKSKRKGGKGNRGSGSRSAGGGGDLEMEELAAQKAMPSTLTLRDPSTAYYGLALLLFLAAAMVIATRTIRKSAERKEMVLAEGGADRSMYCVVDGEAVY